MNTQRLQYFLTAAQTLNLSKTAEIHYISQPSVSQQIKILEDEVGAELFERVGRRLRLTPAGEQFRAMAQNLVDLEQQAISRARYVANFTGKSLNIGLSVGVSIALDWTAFRRFQEKTSPEIDIHLYTGINETLIEDLKTGRLDVMFVVILEGLRLDERLRQVRIANYRYGVCLPTDHPLAKRDVLGYDDLKGQELTYMALHNKKKSIALSKLNEGGIFPTRTLLCDNLEQTALSIYLSKSPVMIYTALGREISRALHMAYVPFDDKIPGIDINMLYLPDNQRPVSRDFCAFYMENACARPRVPAMSEFFGGG